MNLPIHLAIICDGNRRWAKKRHLPEFSGHKYAAETTIQQITDYCLNKKIPYLTFWVLSTENYRRGQKWIKQYFKLMAYSFKKYQKDFLKKGVCFKFIGNLKKLPQNIQKIIKQMVLQSKNNKKITVIIAINYGGRDEILRAVNHLINQPRDLKKSKPVLISEKEFSQYLDTKDIPAPDLLIRTGSKNNRLSGFMLWQISYTELYFIDTFFPDLASPDLDKAIAWFQKQKRNFGI